MELIRKYTLLLFILYVGFNFSMVPQKTKGDYLVGAAAFGNLDGVNKNLQQGPDIPDQVGRTALNEAAKNGHLEIVKKLVSAGASVNKSDNTGQTPIMWAAAVIHKNKSNDYYEILKYLYSQGANIYAQSKERQTILHNAARTGNPQILRLVVSWDTNKQLINATSDKERTPLAEAIRASNESIIHLDLENKIFENKENFDKALVDALVEFKDKEKSKLNREQLLETIDILKNAGARADIPDSDGKTVEYYINNVLTIHEADRTKQLPKLGFIYKANPPASPIPDFLIGYAHLGIEDVIAKNTLSQLNGILNMVKWAIEKAKVTTERTYDNKIAFTRIAMTLLTKAKSLAKENIVDKAAYEKIEEALNQIQKHLRGAVLIFRRKAQ